MCFSHQIPVVADLPVGHNLQDHIYPGGIHFTVDQPVSLNSKRIFTPDNILKYFTKGVGKLMSTQFTIDTLIEWARLLMPTLSAGPMSSTGVDGLAFVSTKFVLEDRLTSDKDWPDIEMHMVPADVVADGGRYFAHLAGLSEHVSSVVESTIK